MHPMDPSANPTAATRPGRRDSLRRPLLHRRHLHRHLLPFHLRCAHARRENCRFFAHPALAERAGFRPCLPLPGAGAGRSPWSIQDASAILARQAARLLDARPPGTRAAPSGRSLAARLGISDRHLRRIFEQHVACRLQYLQTRRLLTAKQLLTDTDLPSDRGRTGQRLCERAALQRCLGPLLAVFNSPSQLRAATRGPARRRLERAPWCWRLPPPYDIAALADSWPSAASRRGAFVAPHASTHAAGAHHRPAGPPAGWWASLTRRPRARWSAVSRRCASCCHDPPAARCWTSTPIRPPPSTARCWACRRPGDGLRVPGVFRRLLSWCAPSPGQQITVAAAHLRAPRWSATASRWPRRSAG